MRVIEQGTCQVMQNIISSDEQQLSCPFLSPLQVFARFAFAVSAFLYFSYDTAIISDHTCMLLTCQPSALKLEIESIKIPQMSPEQLKQHPGELVARYDFVVYAGSEFDMLDVYEADETVASSGCYVKTLS
jgi:hypothetical protein